MKTLIQSPRFLILFSFSIFLLSITSCSNKGDAIKLDTDKKELQLSAGISEAEFQIFASGEWSIEAEGLSPYIGVNMGETGWYTVTPIFGKGDAKITIETKEKTQGNQTILTIKSGNVRKTIKLKQDE